MSIERGDIVHHAPTGEDWVIKRGFTDACGKEFVEPAGWPPCQADASDCTIIKKGGALDFLNRNERKRA